MTDPVRRDAAGFRLRGLQATRIETFTDAAFAFALTLLVISLQPPTSFADLRAALVGIPPFLLSASMLMMFWWAHHEWSRRYGLDDGRSILLSCLLVFTVLVYVYPLRFMFALMFAWFGHLGGLPLDSGVQIDGVADVNRLFVIYGIGYVLMSVAVLLLNWHAWSQRSVLQLDAVERHETRSTIGAWSLLALVGVLSTAIGLWAGPRWPGAPGWIYMLLGPLMAWYARAMKRRRPPPGP